MSNLERISDKSKFMQDFETLRPDFFVKELYSNPEDRAMAAEAVRPARIKTSLFASIPMRCEASRCPFADTCPLQQQNIAPQGNACPLEMALVSQFMESIMEELHVNPDNLIEVSMVRDLVDQEVQQLRATKLLAQESFIQENIIGVDEQGRPLVRKEMHLAVELSDKLLKRKKEIRNQMMATREQKAKIGQGQLDNAQTISNIMDSIRDIEEQKERALRAKLGLTEVDDYVEADKASREADIIDAEIIEES